MRGFCHEMGLCLDILTDSWFLRSWVLGHLVVREKILAFSFWPEVEVLSSLSTCQAYFMVYRFTCGKSDFPRNTVSCNDTLW